MNEIPSPCSKKCLLSHCKNGPLVTDNMSGELMCGSCGIVLSEKMEDYGSDHHSFTLDDYMHKSRTGMKSSLAFYDMGLTTVIESANKDASGKRLSNKMRYEFNRLRVWDSRSKLCTRERGMNKAFIMLNSMASKLYLPDSVSERAAYYYRKIKSQKSLKGNHTEFLICAALYAACRFTDTPRTLNDISQVANVKKKTLQKSYRKIVNCLNLNLKQYDATEFVNRISTGIGASEKTRLYAMELLTRAENARVISGKHPMGMAAAALYYSGLHHNENFSQQMISHISGITSVTIRNSFKALIQGMGLPTLEPKEK